MALTKDFRQTVQACAARDPAFRRALFQEAVQTLLCGDVDAGRAAISSYINATRGFEKLSAALEPPQKSLMARAFCAARTLSHVLSAVIARLDRAIQHAAAYRFKLRRLWNTGSPDQVGR